MKPYLTVYPELPRINPNTANPLVLKALMDSLSADHASKKMIWSRLREACREGNCSFSSADLEPEAFTKKLKLPKTSLMTQAAQNLVMNFTTDSEFFRMTMKTSTGKTASGVFRCREGQGRAEVLEWHES